MDLTLGVALFAGLISFLSPCVLPVVPAYLGQLGAVVARSGEAAVVALGRKAFADGDYRWVVELVNKAVFANPNNAEARALQADHWNSSVTKPSRRPGATPT